MKITFKYYKTGPFKRYILISGMLCLFFLIFYLFYNDVKKNTIQDFNHEQLLLAKTASQGMSAFLDNYISNLLFIGKHKSIIEFSDVGIKTMKYFYETHENGINAITRVDPLGNILYTFPYNESAIGQDISNQKHVQEIMATHKPVISDVFMSVQGYFAIALHVPIFKGNQFVGSLAILIPIDKLGQLFLDNVGAGKKGHAWLITANYKEIYCPIDGHKGKSFLETTNNDPRTIKLLEDINKNISGTGKSIHQTTLNAEDTNQMYVVFQRVPLGNTYWTIIISYQESEVYLALSKFRNRLVVILVLLFIAFIFYFYSLAKVRNILKEETKRREAEKLLRESNERFHGFMENTPIYAYIKDSSLNLIYQNNRVESLIPNKQLQTVSAKDIFDDETAKMIEDADIQILSGKKKNVELEFLTKLNGESVWLKDLKFRIKISENKYAVGGAVLDITDIKKYEKELEEHKINLEKLVKHRTSELEMANKKLKKQKKELEATLHSLKEAQSRLVHSEKMASLGVLTAGVSHEINNPLHYLSGTYYGLANYFKKYGSEDEKITDLLLSSTEVAIQRISSIVNGLNQFSRDNSSYNEDCDIHSIIDNCLTILYNQYKNKVEIIKDFCPQVKPIKGNEGKLHQVFTNILNNSIQSIGHKGQISIITHCTDTFVEVEIADTGCGISPENLSKITDPFFTTKPPGKGTGLGLSITYSIIKEHKGMLEFKSEIEKGTTAIIHIPINLT